MHNAESTGKSQTRQAPLGQLVSVVEAEHTVGEGDVNLVP